MLMDWAQQQTRLARMHAVIGYLAVGILGLIGALLLLIARGTPAYIAPAHAGFVRPGVIEDDSAIDFAVQWLEWRYTFTPATIDARHQRILATLHPSQRVEFAARMKKEAQMVRESQMSSQTTVLDMTIPQRTDSRVLVRLHALRKITLGSQALRDEPLQADIEVGFYKGARGYPEGLAPLSVRTTPPLSVWGE